MKLDAEREGRASRPSGVRPEAPPTSATAPKVVHAGRVRACVQVIKRRTCQWRGAAIRSHEWRARRRSESGRARFWAGSVDQFSGFRGRGGFFVLFFGERDSLLIILRGNRAYLLEIALITWLFPCNGSVLSFIKMNKKYNIVMS